MQIDDRLKKLYIKYYSIESWDNLVVNKTNPVDIEFLQEVTKLLKDAK